MGGAAHVEVHDGVLTAAARQLESAAGTLEGLASTLAGLCSRAGEEVGPSELAGALAGLGTDLSRAVGTGGAVVAEVAEQTRQAGASYRTLEDTLTGRWTS